MMPPGNADPEGRCFLDALMSGRSVSPLIRMLVSSAFLESSSRADSPIDELTCESPFPRAMPKHV